MNCQDYRDALTGAALDPQADAAPRASRDAALRAHLDACAACRAELGRLTALTAAIDAGLAQIVSADPSPAFAARVRSRLAERAEERASRWHAWAPALAGALTAAVLIAWFVTRFASEPDSPSQTAIARPPTQIAPHHGEPPRLVAPLPNKLNGTGRNRRPRVRALRPAPVSNEPALLPVLVSGDEWQQVAKLYALVQSGQADAETLAPPDSAPLAEKFQPLVIAPMDPIKLLDAKPLHAQPD
ncbi:MAG: hypothetical protein ACRD5G_00340 [Candidatus Acidiferrales bacterium]